MKQPVILITGGPAYDPRFHLESRMLNKTYAAAICAAGGLPLMDLDYDAMEDYLELADGFVFTGTHQFNPEGTPDLEPQQRERIEREWEFMRAVMDSKKPMLGICQGMQQINVACGGTLHNYFKTESGVEHNLTWHSIRNVEGTWSHRLFGDTCIVNSSHNVKVDRLAPCFRASAFSPDGVLEAYEHPELPVFAFQWHPEQMRGDFPNMPYGPDTDPVFREFVQLCRKA